jgi:hypothetical protein
MVDEQGTHPEVIAAQQVGAGEAHLCDLGL